MNELPYPVPPTTTSEVVVAYSLREIIDQINQKLDLLPSLVMAQAAHKDEMAKLSARVLVNESAIEAIQHAQDQATGASVFKDKLWAKFVGLAGVMGVVAGITVQILGAFL